ncbi:MAG: hypothetical protein R3A52_18135 [Polyangiales bacterium]
MLRRSVSLAGAIVVVTACASPPPPHPAPAPRVDPPPVTTVDAGPPPTPSAPDAGAPADVSPAPDASAPAEPRGEHVRIFRGRSEDEWLREMSERPVLRTLERFHSTLFVFHMDLGDGVEISFQPERPGQETFWRREVTSYHLARLLGIEHRVPPTVGKRVPLSAFGRFSRGVNLVVDRHGMVLGSASVWMPVLNSARMHLPPARREWSRWVNPAHPLPEEHRERARQVSEVLVFDYLAANYDRWNCCNITVDENNDLVFRDNDAGWFPGVIQRLGDPGVVRRVPRYLFETIQRATPEALRASVANDPMASSVHLVQSGAYEGYERRRQALLANLRRMVERYGEAEVFPWP